ncbi:MAG: hypothetical protein RLY93_01740 [Sumerlaeia bacterium]
MKALSPKCPVCRAKFRASVECPRCGADLRPLMTAILRAWHLRQQAREALRRHDPEAAEPLAADSLRLHATESGRRLHLLARLLRETAPNAETPWQPPSRRTLREFPE